MQFFSRQIPRVRALTGMLMRPVSDVYAMVAPRHGALVSLSALSRRRWAVKVTASGAVDWNSGGTGVVSRRAGALCASAGGSAHESETTATPMIRSVFMMAPSSDHFALQHVRRGRGADERDEILRTRLLAELHHVLDDVHSIDRGHGAGAPELRVFLESWRERPAHRGGVACARAEPLPVQR